MRIWWNSTSIVRSASPHRTPYQLPLIIHCSPVTFPTQSTCETVIAKRIKIYFHFSSCDKFFRSLHISGMWANFVFQYWIVLSISFCIDGQYSTTSTTSWTIAITITTGTTTSHHRRCYDKRFTILTVLTLKCAHYSISEYDYQDFTKLSDIKNSAPDGYILRIVLYIQGSRDANIILTTSNHPNFERDFVYEFGKLRWFFPSRSMSFRARSFLLSFQSHIVSVVRRIVLFSCWPHPNISDIEYDIAFNLELSWREIKIRRAVRGENGMPAAHAFA